MNSIFPGNSKPIDASAFSVVVCTRNRARLLQGTIDSVLTQNYPADRYEVIVVDNDSSDGTRALIERYLTSARVPVSYYLEPRLGSSLARNLGIERSCGDYVAFLDDDTVAMPGWLSAFDVAVREYGGIAGGGPVEPVVESGIEPPLWWRDPNIRCIFGLDHGHLNSGNRVMAIRWPLWLGACNSFYSKRLLQEHSGFRTDCGPVGTKYRVAQDVDLNVRLERSGVPIYYVCDARIKHRITADRLSRRYIWRRAYCSGVTDAHAWAMLGGRSSTAGLPRLVRAALRFLLFGEPARTTAGCEVAHRLGYLRQQWIMALSGRLKTIRRI